MDSVEKKSALTLVFQNKKSNEYSIDFVEKKSALAIVLQLQNQESGNYAIEKKSSLALELQLQNQESGDYSEEKKSALALVLFCSYRTKKSEDYSKYSVEKKCAFTVC